MIPVLKRIKLPFVLVGSRFGGAPSVDLDFLEAYRKAVSILESVSCLRAVFIEGDMAFGYAVAQKRALMEAADKSRVKIFHTFKGDYSMRCGYSIAERIVRMTRKGDCAIFANDRVAAGFYRRCHECGVGIPSRIRVIGCDKDPISAALFPSLSTIVQPRLEMGREAFELLVSVIKGAGSERRICLGQEFLRRDSV
jgi:DNA-binding LacI/PurR family transcriptional regulator